MKKYLIIKADTNDADYIKSKNEITDKQIELLQPVFDVLQARKSKLMEDKHKNWNEYRHNWERGEFARKKTPENLYLETDLLTIDQIALMDKYIPYGEYGIHTIESIDILVVQEEISIL